MTSAQPLLQIVQVSDMHVIGPNPPPMAKATLVAAATLATGLENIANAMPASTLRDKVTEMAKTAREGVRGHSAGGARALTQFLQKIAAEVTCDTWLIVSGDQSTFGDVGSIMRARAMVAGTGTSAAIEFHGNHDAWPHTLPLVTGPYGTGAIANRLRSTLGYPVGVATAALQSGTSPDVQLYTLDSVQIDRMDNTLALGEVDNASLDQLEQEIDANATTGPSLRILVLHHPIRYPGTKPKHTMFLKNADDLGRRLAGSTAKGTMPLVHVVLSGHTHCLDPQLGRMPASAAACHHAPVVGQQQVQLVVGSALQLDPGGTLRHPHQVQILRIYHDPAKPNQVRMERRLGARRGGRIGAFSTVTNRHGKKGESLVITI